VRLAGGSERVILDADVVVPPDPLELTAATVNVYTVPAVSPMNVPPDASTCVVVVGDDVTL
jgi:lipopolysaccharide export system protein LptA